MNLPPGTRGGIIRGGVIACIATYPEMSGKDSICHCERSEAISCSLWLGVFI